jgi:hypothetical protein
MTTSPSFPDDKTGLSQGAITSLAVVGGVALVAVILAGLFFNYRFKVQRQLIEQLQQQQQDHRAPTLPPRGPDDGTTLDSVDAVPMVSEQGTPVMADVILLPSTIPPPPPPERPVPDAVGKDSFVRKSEEKDKEKYAAESQGGPDFKDQTRSMVESPQLVMMTSSSQDSPAIDHHHSPTVVAQPQQEQTFPAAVNQFQ